MHQLNEADEITMIINKLLKLTIRSFIDGKENEKE